MFEQITTKGTVFTDPHGRTRIFNGVNYVFKGEKPDEDGIVHYHHPLTEENLRDLRQKGVNIMRLGMTWAGIEPEMGKYNHVYLDEVRQVIDAAAKEGIYVFLDWHQDLYSGFGLGVGDGAPAWACLTKKKMKKPRFIWAEGYFFGGAVFECFDAFWHNRDLAGRGVQDRFCDMLAFTVQYLSGAENIMGYDVLNEPYPGSEGGKVFRKRGPLFFRYAGQCNSPGRHQPGCTISIPFRCFRDPTQLCCAESTVRSVNLYTHATFMLHGSAPVRIK